MSVKLHFHAAFSHPLTLLAALLLLGSMCLPGLQPATAQMPETNGEEQGVNGWLRWRGPLQNGISLDSSLPKDDLLKQVQWSIDLAGRGTPVVAAYPDGTRLFGLGYRGQGRALQEILFCVDADTGKVLWEKGYSDFLSDIVYNRYSIGSPTVDPATGHIYVQLTSGIVVCLDRDGKELWQVSMMETFGRLTFPNGRTGAPAVDGDLVIINAITSNWGSEGPARNRFYAFEKDTGKLVWSSDPGVGPPYLKDSSFATPIFEDREGYRLFYVGTGCGNVVCVNARTGEPLWRYQFAAGGINSSMLIADDRLVAVHGKENIDDSLRGRMIGVDLAKAFKAWQTKEKPGPVALDRSFELWRNNDVSMFTASPVLVDDRVYQVTLSGMLACVDVKTGRTIWEEKLGVDQLHASPIYADGLLYVPMWHDGFCIVRPKNDGIELVERVSLEGDLIGSPIAWNGKLYLHTLRKLYCFGSDKASDEAPAPWPRDKRPTMGEPTGIAIVPRETILNPGESKAFDVYLHDQFGVRSGRPVAAGQVSWEKFVPPTALVKAEMDATMKAGGTLVAGPDAKQSAGSFKATYKDFTATMRGRVLPAAPFEQNFDSFELTVDSPEGKYAHPPLPWIGARMKWRVVDLDGQKVLAKTLDNVLFQRSIIFMGREDASDYTVQVDVMSDGNRRSMSSVGVVNQRYMVALVGNSQVLEVASNYDLLNVSVPFAWKPGQWYTIKARVDRAQDGSGVVRGKAWLRGEPEPADWTIEVPVPHCHASGSPGLYGFSPQSQKQVFVDNVKVTPNE